MNQQMFTDTTRAYSFLNLVPGKYNVYEIQPGFYIDGAEVAGIGATGDADRSHSVRSLALDFRVV